MTNSSTALGRIGQIALTVHDMDRAIAFWRDTVGLKFLFQAPNVAFAPKRARSITNRSGGHFRSLIQF